MARWRRSPLPPEWDKTIRPAILERDGHVCQLRLSGCSVAATEVHHIRGHDDHRPGNLMAVCGPCHRTETARRTNAARPKRKRPPPRHPGLRW
jgi:5-methylcytosine-specific restriction protein A